ncbi:MAG: tetratricopeptide repeat protein, partial [Thermodesulfovibrionales bacterium]|nr:tetratricopeptide repeat protein [Thermodesulfovibrionales bacterium]
MKAMPRNFEACYYLAKILHDTSQWEEAVAYYLNSIELMPDFAGPYYNLASLMKERGQLEEALKWYKKVITIDPEYAETYNTIGGILQLRGRIEEAETYFRKALAFKPDFAMARNNLGNILLRKGRIEEALICYQKAVELNPNYAKAYCGLGMALQEKDNFDEAEINYRRALQINPSLAEVWSNLGRVCHARGKFEEAEMYYRRALQLKPDFTPCYGNLLLLLNYSPRYDARSVFTEHLGFAKQIAEAFYPASPHYESDLLPLRRLKIGYVSPDFRRHSVNYFLEPVLASHDHKQFEIFCYSDVMNPDVVTERVKGYADQWREIAGIPDLNVAEMVRKDRIDLLIDLAGHTGYNRMLVFARKPAPVQITWLGYPNTTGLSTVDYRIVDGYTDPPGLTDAYYAEKLVRLPHSFLCYLP